MSCMVVYLSAAWEWERRAAASCGSRKREDSLHCRRRRCNRWRRRRTRRRKSAISPGPGYYDIEDEEIELELRWAGNHDAQEEQQQRGNQAIRSGCGSNDNGGTGMEMENEQQEDDEEDPPPRLQEEEDAPPPPPWSSTAPSQRSLIGDMRVEHTGALDCGICFLPLKPPIFQCEVGHVLCLRCQYKLAAGKRCHVCRRRTTFPRCFAMEQLVSSICVPCPHAGCGARPAYHSWHAQVQWCAHAPCCCIDKSCGFLGSSMAALLDHFAGAHGWQCTRETISRAHSHRFPVHLRDGFNFVITAVRESLPDQGTVSTTPVHVPPERGANAIRPCRFRSPLEPSSCCHQHSFIVTDDQNNHDMRARAFLRVLQVRH
ncbi:hypothetical protein PR202_gb24841 [Eleusine coracana subsp. coracana]|uniref:E3 ubiquitin-protein ligase Sina-like RING finger domain-containing protein n=1 Tax=Eleusine coracana subsp. coracana TaxID=191504 RepID=A0AAV5FM94_ELECO|nr:hypothetical protein PR202_gb24841 [Eleusine coracana subsp. coracana]